MNRRRFALLLTATIFLFVFPYAAFAQQDAARPISGKEVEKFAPFDPIIEKHMDHIGATAASFAVQLNGRIVYSRAYGWADKEMKVPVTTESTFRIASNTKPITKAIVRQLIKKKKDLKLSTKVIPLLNITPVGELGDERLNDITIEHLLNHTGGWDQNKSFDPLYRSKTLSEFHKIDVEDLTKEHVASYMLTQPLQNEPGAKKAYSNFGFVLLGLVIEKVTEETYSEAVDDFASKLKMDVQVSAKELENRDEAEVSYPKEYRLRSFFESSGGLACSAESLCKFMKKYWTTGKRRSKKQKLALMHYGRHVRCTNALMEHRKDGIDYVILFNSTRAKGYYDDIKLIQKDVTDAIEKIKNSN